MTPMLEQYFNLKESVKPAVLFFRMGDFYEIFGEDAVVISPLLEIVLTSREKEKGSRDQIPFCGVPYHSARSYISKLVGQGFKIAIAEQMEDSKSTKNLIKREIVKVLTPACHDLDEDGVRQANYGVAIQEIKEGLEGLFFDCSTLKAIYFSGTREDFLNVCLKMNPSQILVRKYAVDYVKSCLSSFFSLYPQVCFDFLPERYFGASEESQKQAISEIFGPNFLKDLKNSKNSGQKVSEESLKLCAATSQYLKALQWSKPEAQTEFRLLNLFATDRMTLKAHTLRDLDILSYQNQKTGSLLHFLDQTSTAMGSRLLSELLIQPFTTLEPIEKRKAVVSDFQNMDEITCFQKGLSKTFDLNKLSSRLQRFAATPKDLCLIAQSIGALLQLQNQSKNPHVQKLSVNILTELLDFLKKAIKPTANTVGSGIGVIEKGFDETYDRYFEFATQSEQKIANYEQNLKEKTGITSLKIKEHQSFGFLIEVTKSNISKAPDFFIRKQTMVNAERYVTEELIDFQSEILKARDEIIQCEEDLFKNILNKASLYVEDLKILADELADLDVSVCLARHAFINGWTKAENSDDEFELMGMRHPVVEQRIGKDRFVPNSMKLKKPQKTVLITGPNMGGKSTFMRQVLISAILNQIGSYVPAVQAKLPIFDALFTRIGTADDILEGHSTFMVEMLETAEILTHATSKSLVVIDELGRGTSTEDGFALARSILSELAHRLQSYTFFSTHFHKLHEEFKNSNSFIMMQSQVITEDQEINFTHLMIPGVAEKSYGIDVAKKAGIPQNIIVESTEYLSKTQEIKPVEVKSYVQEVNISENIQNLIGRLERVQVFKTNPLQALNILNELQSYLSIRKKKRPDLNSHLN